MLLLKSSSLTNPLLNEYLMLLQEGSALVLVKYFLRAHILAI